MRPGTTTRANRAMTEDYQQQERWSRIRYGVTGTRRIRHGVTGTVVSPELGHRHLGLCVLSPVRYGSHFQHVIIRRCPRNLPEMRPSIRSCKTSFDIGYRLRWWTPSGVGSRLRVSARGRRFFTEDGLPGAGVVRLRHFNPVIDGRISKNPGELLAYREFLHLQHFLLDTVSRHGQDVGVRTAYWSQEVNNGRQDSGEL